MSRNGKRARRKPYETTTITDLASNGRGVGHVEGKAIFVADSLPGESVLYQPVKVKKQYEEAALVTLFSAAETRTTPRCRHFGLCGGCILQHASADTQLIFKQSQLLNALSRVGRVAPEQVLAPLTGARWGYRRRARLGVKHVPKKGGTLVGFRERGAPFIAQLSRCEVLIPAVGDRLRHLAAMIDTLSIRDRIPQIEVAAADNAIALVFRVLDEPSAADRNILSAFAAEHGFVMFLQPGNEQTITPLDDDTPALYYDLPAHEARLFFRPNDFVQIHAEINQAMVTAALDALDVQSDDTVLELFSGLGNFSVPLARRAQRVVTVEGEAGLVSRAQDNARHNGCTNIEAHVDNLFEPSQAPDWLVARVDKVLIDPPRSGAAEIIDLVASRRPRRIVYCSCHPATLARDAERLVHEYGYTLAAAGIMDMFPHTAHIESMAVFVREPTDGD